MHSILNTSYIKKLARAVERNYSPGTTNGHESCQLQTKILNIARTLMIPLASAG